MSHFLKGLKFGVTVALLLLILICVLWLKYQSDVERVREGKRTVPAYPGDPRAR